MTSIRHTAATAESLSPTVSARPRVPDSVLDATRASVLAVGVRRTTLTDVARRAGVSRMTLYRRVPDVTTLILELMTREFGGLITAAENDAAGLPTARERLIETTVRVVERLPQEPLFQRIVDVDPELLLPYLTERFGSTQLFAVAHVRAALAQGIADGSVRRCDPDVVAHALLLTVMSHVVSARPAAAVVDPDLLTAELRRQLDAWLAP
jgi:AcrR family transcriptional regulator